MTISGSPQDQPTPQSTPHHLRWLRRGTAVALSTTVLIGGAVGVGMAVGSSPTEPMGSQAMTSAGASAATGPSTSAKARRGTPADRQAWAHKYGVDRATMSNLPDVASATPAQRVAAADLLHRTEAATAKYSSIAAATAAGFDFAGSLARAEQKHPKMAAGLALVDAGKGKGKMPMLHVANKANHVDGKVLDPNAPETLMYGYEGKGVWTLVGVMYTANEAFPAAPPDPGGPITRWHYHDNGGGQALMMHVFFVTDLAHAYAAEMRTDMGSGMGTDMGPGMGTEMGMAS